VEYARLKRGERVSASSAESKAAQSRAVQPRECPQILDLRHYGAHSLRPLLDRVSRRWAERMDWDYRASTELLLQYLDARVLPGFVAVEEGRVVGYAFCVYEDRKAIVGDLFAMDNAAGHHVVEQTLLEHLLQLLIHSPGVERVESQLLLHEHGEHEPTFRRFGFRSFRRLFMECELAADGTAAPQLAPGFTMRPWQESDFQNAGSLIARAYEGHIDARINDQYRSLAGSQRFLHNIIHFPGCGVFDGDASRVVEQRGMLAGLLLCSRVRADVAHVTQACVAPGARGLGLASAMLRSAMGDLRARGLGRISLTVTAGNANAESLYARLGFRERHSFDALVWERAEATTPGALL
jgi:ribosomal protein S18 acetylase RimI-like enzyme